MTIVICGPELNFVSTIQARVTCKHWAPFNNTIIGSVCARLNYAEHVYEQWRIHAFWELSVFFLLLPGTFLLLFPQSLWRMGGHHDRWLEPPTAGCGVVCEHKEKDLPIKVALLCWWCACVFFGENIFYRRKWKENDQQCIFVQQEFFFLQGSLLMII